MSSDDKYIQESAAGLSPQILKELTELAPETRAALKKAYEPPKPTTVYIDVKLAEDEARGTSTLTARLTVPSRPNLAQYATMLPFVHEAVAAYRIGKEGHDPFEVRTWVEGDAALAEVIENSGGKRLAENIGPIISAMQERRFRPVVGISYKEGQLTGNQWTYGKNGWHDLYCVEIRQDWPTRI